MVLRARIPVLLFFSLSAAIIMLIATSLSELELKPGTPFPGQAQQVVSDDSPQKTGYIKTYHIPLLLQGLLGLTCMIYLTYLVVRSLFTLDLKWSFHPRRLLPFILVLGFFIISVVLSRFSPVKEGTGIWSNAPSQDYSIAPIGSPPAMIQWIVISILLLIACACMVLIFRYKPERFNKADEVLLAAENALSSLERGENVKNVILACYEKMGRVLMEEQGIERDQSMTAREFEKLLQARGIPFSPVHHLTLLFEAVRYGDLFLNQETEQRGEACLNEIISNIRGEREKKG